MGRTQQAYAQLEAVEETYLSLSYSHYIYLSGKSEPSSDTATLLVHRLNID